MPVRRGDLKQDKQGRFYRSLGLKHGPNDSYIQHKFRFGRDRKAAEQAVRRLEMLWERIEETHAEQKRQQWWDETPSPALWNSVTLKIANAIAKGQSAVEFEITEGFGVYGGQLHDPRLDETPRMFALRLRRLAVEYPVIAFVPAPTSLEDFELGEAILRKDAVNATREATLKRQLIEQPAYGDALLHDALDAYKHWIESEYKEPQEDGSLAISPWGSQQLRNVDRLKERHENVPLSSLSLPAVEAMFQLWRQRPTVKGKHTRIAASTAKHQIKQLRHFLKWLHRSPDFEWRKPDGFEDIKTSVKETRVERVARSSTEQVSTFSLDELRLLNEYATPIERVFLLLGLNCGFKWAEMGTLLLNEVRLRNSHPMPHALDLSKNTLYPEVGSKDSFILRTRHKTGVYGEHLLFPQTVQALEWLIERRKRVSEVTRGKRSGQDIPMQPNSVLLVAESGVPYLGSTQGHNRSQRFQNLWNALIRRIRKDHPEFRGLPQSALRKTAGNFVRQRYGGEIMAVFHCRGQAVRIDDLAEVYSNRPFGRVFEAIKELEGWLQPVFEAAPPDPFPAVRKKGGANITKRQAQRIRQLRAEKKSIREIAEKVKVSKATVHRHLQAAEQESGNGKVLPVSPDNTD